MKQAALLLTAAAFSFSGCAQKPFYVQERRQQSYPIDSTRQVADSTVANFLKPYKAGVDTQMKTIIGYTDIPLTKAQPESSLGNFMADAQLVAARKIDGKVAASILNYGGIRLNYVSPGNLTRGTMYELMPFDNMLSIVEIPGGVVQQFCDFMAVRKGWPVSGISYVIKDKKADSITINGQPLNPHLIYKIATNDYLARGGDNCDFLLPLRKRNTSVFLRDAMMDFVIERQRNNQPLHPEIENRVRYAE